jgi:predicted Fe-Mo cluster-binding NifX family protein
MKIAIPTIGSILDQYMGSCEVFTIYTIDDASNVVDSELLYTPEGCDCKNNIPLTLQQKGVTAVVGYRMPEHAEGLFTQHGIKFYEGFSGNVADVLAEFLKQIKDESVK